MLDRVIAGSLIIIAVAVVVAAVGGALGNRSMVRAGGRVAAILGALMVIGWVAMILVFTVACWKGCDL
jgi:hypothetical protein